MTGPAGPLAGCDGLGSCGVLLRTDFALPAAAAIVEVSAPPRWSARPRPAAAPRPASAGEGTAPGDDRDLVKLAAPLVPPTGGGRSAGWCCGRPSSRSPCSWSSCSWRDGSANCRRWRSSSPRTGIVPPPEGTPVGIPAWLGHTSSNLFFLLLIVRTGYQLRSKQRPPGFWTRGQHAVAAHLAHSAAHGHPPLVPPLARRVLGAQRRVRRRAPVRDRAVAAHRAHRLGGGAERALRGVAVRVARVADRELVGGVQPAAAAGLLHDRVHRVADRDPRACARRCGRSRGRSCARSPRSSRRACTTP